MEQLWEFGGRAILIAVLCSALLGAFVGWALASWGRYSRILGGAVGALTSIPGLAVLLIVSIVRVNSRKLAAAQRTSAPESVAVEQNPGFSTFSDDSTHQYSSSGFGQQTVESSTAGFGFAAYDAAPDYSAFDSAWNEPIQAGPLETVDQSAVTRRFDWIRGRMGLSTAGVAVGAGLVLLATLIAAWLSVDAAVIPRFWVYSIGTGLDLAVVISVILCATAILFVAYRPYRWAAVLLAVVAQSWLFFALMTMSARQSVAQVLKEVGALSLTVGDTLTALGVKTKGGQMELPPEIDLSSLGITGTTIDVNAVELGAAIPDVTIDLGPALYMLIAFAVLASIAAALILIAADRVPERAPRQERNRRARSQQPQ